MTRRELDADTFVHPPEESSTRAIATQETDEGARRVYSSALKCLIWLHERAAGRGDRAAMGQFNGAVLCLLGGFDPAAVKAMGKIQALRQVGAASIDLADRIAALLSEAVSRQRVSGDNLAQARVLADQIFDVLERYST